jgi:hypothetical protein
MYLALFLTPWMLMYALSTMAMNHREWFSQIYGEKPVFQKEGEQIYPGVFPEGASARDMARQILITLAMDGAHNVNAPKGGDRIIINRNDPVTPRRITYTPADKKLVIEKVVFQPHSFLERLHRRRGYQSGYALENTWSFSVDTVIFAIVFWVLSGLWLWWEMKLTRRWGAVFAVAGCVIFGFFLFTI